MMLSGTTGDIWEPITVEIVVSAVSQLRDAAMGAFGAAGDTVIIDGVTVVEGTAGRGVYRIFGMAGLLLSMDGGGPMGTKIWDPPINWDWLSPTNETASGTLTGYWNNGSYCLGKLNGSTTPSVTLDAGSGVCSMVDTVLLTVDITGLDYDMNGFGTVTFYIGDYIRTVDVCASQTGDNPYVYGVSIPVNGTDIGGAPTGSYTATAVYNGAVSDLTAYCRSESNSVTVGVN
jgi:hypothetical protein